MEIKLLAAEEAWEVHGYLVEKLYKADIKPNALRLPYAEVNVGVKRNKKWVAMASIFSNDAFEYSGMVGNYECVDNAEVAKFLFDEIENSARQKGFTDLIGPMHGDTWHSYRFSLLPKKPFLMESLHNQYYPAQWQQNGFTNWAEYQTNIEAIKKDIPQTEADFYFADKNLTIMPFNNKKSIEDLKKIHAFCTQVFVHNFMYTPISEPDFLALYTPLLPHLKPSLIDLVLDKDKMVGLIFAIDNLYTPQEVIVKTIARDLSDEYKGLAHHLAAKFQHKAFKMGYETMLHAYFHVENKSSRVSSNYDGQLYQQHVLYRKELK
jgi:hypothetical protein